MILINEECSISVIEHISMLGKHRHRVNSTWWQSVSQLYNYHTNAIIDLIIAPVRNLKPPSFIDSASMLSYIYIYIYIHTHRVTHINICMHIHIYTHIHIYAYTHIHTYISNATFLSRSAGYSHLENCHIFLTFISSQI